MPAKLRPLDPEASWSQSGDHGWVYGSGLPLVDHRGGLPTWVPIATAAVAESAVLAHQATPLIQDFPPATVTTENRDAKARRLRPWAQQGVGLRSPAVTGVKGRYALASQRDIPQPENAAL
jgi:hypothetical protein